MRPPFDKTRPSKNRSTHKRTSMSRVRKWSSKKRVLDIGESSPLSLPSKDVGDFEDLDFEFPDDEYEDTDEDTY